ncbi:MAG: hypothetical protein Q7T11_09530 [Deltaproteobacteria bacterium]|nr:hypothetical protein [Deltaproteobacteria bacterium]
MNIKPIKPIERVQQSEIAGARTAPNAPKPLLLNPPPGNWNFSSGRIILNGKDVGLIIEQSRGEPAAFWSKLANDLDDYRKFYLRKYSRKRKKKGVIVLDDPTGELGHLSAMVEAYIGKIMRILKRKYDETADGLSYVLDEDGQLCVNGVNVTSFIEMARDYPSKKAQIFLKGLKTRLGIILSNKARSHNYEKIRETIQTLFLEIDLELKRIVEKDRLIENV